MVGKNHKELLRDIRKYSTQLNGSKIALVDFWIESSYQDAKGETRPCFLITKKGCEFIANKLTGSKGAEFTARYVNRFHEMSDKLHELDSAKLNIIDDRLKAIEQQLRETPGKKYTPWKTSMFRKLHVLRHRLEDKPISLGKAISHMLRRLEIDNDVVVNDYVIAYKAEQCILGNPYVLDVLEYYDELNVMAEETMDRLQAELCLNYNSMDCYGQEKITNLATTAKRMEQV